MPTDMTIPTMVDFYLEVIGKLAVLSSNHDSLSSEAKLFNIEIQHYLGLIREEMAEAAKEQNEYKEQP